MLCPVWQILLLSLIWKFYSTIPLHQWLFFLSTYTPFSHQNTSYNQDAIFLNYSPPLSSMRFKILGALLLSPRGSPLECFYLPSSHFFKIRIRFSAQPSKCPYRALLHHSAVGLLLSSYLSLCIYIYVIICLLWKNNITGYYSICLELSFSL